MAADPTESKRLRVQELQRDRAYQKLLINLCNTEKSKLAAREFLGMDKHIQTLMRQVAQESIDTILDRLEVDEQITANELQDVRTWLAVGSLRKK